MSKVVTTDKGTGFSDHWLVRTAAYFSALFLSSAWIAHAQNPSATLAWDRNAETNLSNYVLRYGITRGGSYTGQVTVAASSTTATVNNLVQGQTYFFIVTARNTLGMESDPSNEANHYVPRPGTNAVPIANAQSVTATEDTARTITLSGSDADGDPLTYSIVTGPSSGTLSGTAPNLTYTPTANFSGADGFTFRVNDGRTNSAVATVLITVSAVNDSPTLSTINNLTLPTNAGPQNVSLAGIGSGAANESQTLSVTASSSNPSLVPNPSVTYTSPNTTGSLSFTPAAGAGGNVTITVTVNDGQAQNNSFSRTFSVTIGSPSAVTLLLEAESGTVTAPMEIASDPDASNGQYVYSQTANLGTVSFNFNLPSAGDYVVWCRNLSTAGNSDSFSVAVDGGAQDVYDTADNTWGPDWQWGQLKGRTAGTPWVLTLSAGAHTLTFQGREAMTKLDSFYVTTDRNFTPGTTTPNAAPTLNAISNVTLSEDTGLQTVNLAGITDGSSTENQTLTVTASSSNTGLIPTPAVNYTSPNTTGTLSFTPVANVSGTATITVTVNDGQSQNNTVTRNFTVTIGAANDPPTLNPISNVTANEDAGAQSVSLTGIGSGAANETQTLTVTASSSNTGLIPTPGISYNSPNATGTLSFTPAANASGTATLSVTVNDGQAANNTVTRTFTVTINPVNDTPTLNSIANVNIGEDAGTQTVNLTGIGSGASDESQPLTVSASSSNTGLIPTPSISYSSPNTTATLSFAPAAEATGTATITVTVNDGQAANNTFSRTFTVTVTGVNDPPTLGALSDLNINEDAGPQVVNLAGISAGANESQSLTITAVSSAPSIVPNPTVSYASQSATGTLTLRPVTNTFGSATITVTVNDGQAQNNTVTRTFNVSVANVNDPPTISNVANQAINEDTATAAIPFTVADIDTAVGSLTVSGSSSSLSLVPNANIVFGGSGANRTVTVTPAPSVFGSATITIQVSDGNGGSASDSFTLTVNGVNQPPTLNPLNPVTLNEDAGPQSVTLTGIGSGAANEIQPLTVTASSSNPSLIAPTVQYASPNATGVLNFTPAANANGSATITVTVNDGQSANNTVSRTFTVTVNSQNDPPTISDLANQTIAQNAATALLPFTVGDLETAAASLTVTADSANPTLLPNSGVTLGGSGANRTLRLTPALNQYGSAFVTVTVSDGNGGLSSDSLLLVVNAGNLTPTLDPLVALTLAEDGPTQTVGLTGITSGSVNENQSLSVTAVSSDPAIVPHPTVSYASPSPTGSLSLRPLANANGSAVITVTVNDGQSQNNIITRSFLVSVTSINDAPTLNPLANVALNENAGAQTVPLAGISSGAANENQALTVTAVSSNPSLIPNPTVGYFSPNTTGTLNFTPAANADGTATITVTVNDGQSENNTVVRVFTVSVSGANNPPTITDLPDISIPMNGIASPLNFVVGDSETAPESLVVVVTSSNPALVWTNNITTSGTGSNRVASIRTTVGAAGFSIITFTVYDTDGASASESFVLTAVPANAAPTLDPLSNMILGEDAVVQTIPLTGITSGSASENQTLIVSAVSSTPSVIPHPTVNYTSPNATGTLVFQPLPNVAGSATIIVTVNDGQRENNVMTRTFGVLVNNVNDPPSISSIPNQIVDQGVATPPIPFVIGDEETPIASLNVSTASSDTTLVPISNIVLSGTGASRTVRVTPVSFQSGSATITIFVNDGALTASSSFNVSVGSGNTAPLIVAPASLNTDSYTPLTNVAVRVNDQESRPEDLVLSAISYNQTVLPVTNIIFGGAGSNRTVTFKPVPGKSGTVTISLGVSDGRAISRTLCQVYVALGTAPKAKLNVRRKGKGSVEPALDGLDLTLGATYTLTAIPAPGELFVGWSGSLTSRLAKVSFVMKTNFSLECAFTNSPYPGMQGTYNGLFYEVAGARQESSGNFSLLPTERGAYSGKLKLGSATYSISGQVDLSCKTTNVVSRKVGLPLRVELDFGGRSNQVVGRVTDGSWEAPLLGDRAVFSSLSHPAPFAGRYTLVLPGQNDAAQGPEGDGSAMLKIDGNGMVTMAGTLADGTKVSAKMPVSADGQWPLYLPLYSGTGSALSWLTFSPRAGDDVHGLLSWIKGSSLKAKIYPGGFTNECLAMGSVFTAPPKGSARVLNLSQADLTFGGGDLLVPFTNELVFDALGKIVNLSPNKLSIKLNTASGLISGSVTDPTTAQALKFTGAVFQKQNLGSGFSLGTSHSARFVLHQ